MDVRSVRKNLGITQSVLAVRTGIDRCRLSMAENGFLVLRPEEEAAIRRVAMDEIAVRHSAVLQEIGVAVTA